MKDYDAWKLSGPPEADEEEMRAECTEPRDDDDDPCDFDGWVTAWVTDELTTWTCPKCDAEHEENTRDRFDDY
jgi:hypothetical protein